MAEKMGSGIQIDQDDFKTVIKQFVSWIKVVEKEMAYEVKT